MNLREPPPTWRAVLGRVVFVGSNGVRDVQSQVAEFLTQGLPGDPQQAGGLLLIPTGVLQDAGQQDAVHLARAVGG